LPEQALARTRPEIGAVVAAQGPGEFGPAWNDVADPYPGKRATTFTFEGTEYPLIEGLVMRVTQGGSGDWGTVPMLANDPRGCTRTTSSNG